jgi:hypothetical protein
VIVRSVSDISRILINSKKEISNSLILDKININMELPKEFIEYTSSLFGEEKWKNYLASFDGSVPVSVRLNPFKCRPTRPLPPPSPVEGEPECSKDSLFKGDIYDFIGDDCDRIGSLSTGEGGGRGLCYFFSSSNIFPSIVRRTISVFALLRIVMVFLK